MLVNGLPLPASFVELVRSEGTPEHWVLKEDVDAASANESGFIPCLADFARVVWFGDGHEDSPVCFDFRDNLQEPSIIYGDDVYWRRVAPNFETLISLYTPDPDINRTCADPIETTS